MPTARRPKIWIDPELVVDGTSEKAPRTSLSQRYAEAVWRAGGLPCVLPPIADSAFLDGLLDDAGGILLSGGDDFDTERFGLGATHPAANPVPGEKQDFDRELAERALARGLPVLGICYGMQLMGLLGGGRLHQHLPEDQPSAQEHRGGVVHSVRLQTESKLARALGVASIMVISRHHQALSSVGKDWRVVGRDEDGLIEAIERTGDSFAIGVQWHPELAAPDEATTRVFEAFVTAARGYAKRETHQYQGADL